MIKYNFRYRGQFEESKFALSILSFVNEINDIKEEINNMKDFNNILKEQIMNHAIHDTYIELYKKGANN